MADNEANDGSGWTEMVMGRPWANISRYIDMMKRGSTSNESFAPPNFLHPFGDPERFQKLKNDRRTSVLLEDPEYVSLMKESQEHPEAFDDNYKNPKFKSKIILTLRVLLFGKDSNAYGDKPPPPGTGSLSPEIAATWMGVLYSMEEDSISDANDKR